MNLAYSVPATGGPLESLEDFRRHVTAAVGDARRTLAIYTQDLEPDLYDHDPFLEAMKRLVLTRSHARVRVLIADPDRTIRDGNRFVAMARRLTSSIDLRNVPKDLRHNPAAFLVADNNVTVFRADAGVWNGMARFDDMATATRHLAYFDTVWQAAAAEFKAQQAAFTG